MRCFLSGYDIQRGQYSREHFYPKSKLPYYLQNEKSNIFPAIKIFNSIKGDLLPCEWYDVWQERCYSALQRYRLKPSERRYVKRLLETGLPEMNPCDFCLGFKYHFLCKKYQR